MTRIACLQISPRIASLEHNRRLTTTAIRGAVAAGADIVVLPELATSGYVFRSAAEAEATAISADDALFDEWAAEAAAGPAVVIGGFAERGAGGVLHNSAAVVDGGGVLQVYRKTHLWDREKLFFTAGSETPSVVETAAGVIGVLICYDLEFPEMTRTLALAGADLIVVPTNWPLVARPPGERPPEVIAAMAAARASRVFVACCDRTGTERGQRWTAGSAIVDRDGWVVAAAATSGRVVADVDLGQARHKAWTDLSDALGDRRPELYRALVEPPADC